MANSIARRQPAITFILSCRIKREATSKVRKNESHAYDWFHGIDELDRKMRLNIGVPKYFGAASAKPRWNRTTSSAATPPRQCTSLLHAPQASSFALMVKRYGRYSRGSAGVSTSRRTSR